MNRSGVFVLALLIGFLVYRIALTTLPLDQWIVSTCPLPGTVLGKSDFSNAVEFDPVTGFPVLPPCTFAYPLDAVTRAHSHWLGSLLLGLATVIVLTWWPAYRGRRNLALRDLPDLLRDFN